MAKDLTNKIKNVLENWIPPVIPDDIPHGDMPGDKVSINQTHIDKALIIFPKLIAEINQIIKEKKDEKPVVSVYGGSGVGKSEIASLLSYFLSEIGIGSYTLSGDNYPLRNPHDNDNERFRYFCLYALDYLAGIGKHGKKYSGQMLTLLHTNREALKNYYSDDWFENAVTAGENGLRSYLGTEKELDFPRITNIIREFKESKDKILLKRMGRTIDQLWFDEVDFAAIDILVIEWTHGNSDHLKGVDIPILLDSTPEETLMHRLSRNRDKGADGVFVELVLKIEQELLKSQTHKAKIIITQDGKLMDKEAIV
jgi:alpha-galactosidase